MRPLATRIPPPAKGQPSLRPGDSFFHDGRSSSGLGTLCVWHAHFFNARKYTDIPQRPLETIVIILLYFIIGDHEGQRTRELVVGAVHASIIHAYIGLR